MYKLQITAQRPTVHPAPTENNNRVHHVSTIAYWPKQQPRSTSQGKFSAQPLVLPPPPETGGWGGGVVSAGGGGVVSYWL